MKKWIVVVLTAILLCGCGIAPQAHESTFFAMDTVMNITIYGGDDKLLTDAMNLVGDLEKKLSVTDERSEIAKLNEIGRGELSEDTAALLHMALYLCDRSGGLLDVTIYPVLRSWGFTGDSYRIPEETELQDLLKCVDYRQIEMDGNTAMLPEGVMVDLGSVGKGYTSDTLCSFFKEKGVKSACINLGGNVQTIGGKPDGSAWRVGIADPESNETVGAVELRDQAAITSGMYQRYFVGADGTVYGHIIDPRTGHPADSDLQSVTVVGSSGVLCDGFSTTLFIAGLEDAGELWRNSNDFEAIFILKDGSVVITEGLEKSFALFQSEREIYVMTREG